MGPTFESLSVPEGGERVEYDDGFRPPEAPIVPVVHGVDDELVTATRRVLAAVARRTGREINWMRVYAGEEATDRYGTPIPPETVRALRRFRVGLLGPLADARTDALGVERDLRDRLGITTAVAGHATLDWLPSPLRGDPSLDVTVFRNVTEDAAAGLEYGPDRPGTEALRDALVETADGRGAVPGSPAGYSVSPISRESTEALVDAALEYAFDHDRDTLTVVHQGDLRAGSEGPFRDWARHYLAAEYDDGTVDESTFREEYDGGYPEDEVVVFERRTDELCRELLVDPAEYDVLLAPALGGGYVSTVAAQAAGKVGGEADLGLGDGRLIVSARPAGDGARSGAGTNPIPMLLAGCLLFEYLGWMDAASTARAAISAALAHGQVPEGGYRRTARGTPVSPAAFADAVVDRLGAPDEGASGGVETAAEERSAIKGAIAGLYGVVFEGDLAPADVELNQLLGEDEEADVYLPEVGINFRYWRRWPVERRIEVLLHEFAHVEEEPGERDHGGEFYERFVELVEIAEDRIPELEATFGETVDFERVHRVVVESVHEGTIEPDLDRVADRKRWLRERFDLDAADHY